MDKKTHFKGYFFIICSVLIWSTGEVIVKLIQNSIGPLQYAFLKLFIGGLFIFLILTFKGDFSIGKMVKENWILFIISSCLALGFSNFIFFVGIKNTQANLAAVLCSTSPVWITIFAFFLLNEKKNLKTKFIGIILGVFGVFILLTNLNFIDFISSKFFFGNLCALSAEISWSIYTVLGKKIQIRASQNTSNNDLKFTSLSFFLASIPVFVILTFTPAEFENFLKYNFNTWLFILVLGVVFSGIAYITFFKGLKLVDISKGASLIFLKPIFSTIFAFIILGEAITIFLIISSILVIISIYIINKNSKMEEN